MLAVYSMTVHAVLSHPLAVGSVLLAYAGRKSDAGCFIQLSEDSTLSGFTIYYPEQVPEQVPLPYPWYACSSISGELINSIKYYVYSREPGPVHSNEAPPCMASSDNWASVCKRLSPTLHGTFKVESCLYCPHVLARLDRP